MTRAEFEEVRLRLMTSGVCPACGAPFDMERLRTLLLVCANPTCNFSYQAALNERVEIAPREDGPSPARLPLRES
jgi:ssDNA-binding Zn-finger/Zn-ribbon topoisomerase 1